MNILEFLNFTLLNQSAETIEIFLRNASFSTLFLSMMFYWIQTAFSSTKKIALAPPLEMTLSQRAQPLGELDKEASSASAYLLVEKKTLNLGLFKSVFMPKFLSSKAFFLLRGPKEASKGINFGTLTMVLSNLLLVCLLIFRWRESGHFPLSNLYESLMFLSWSCTCIHLILDQVVKKTTAVVRLDATLLTKLIGSITSPSALFTNAFATFSLPPEMQKASPLVPALQSNWLMMHVTVMIISYSALILGSLLSIAFLILISANPSSTNLDQKPLTFPIRKNTPSFLFLSEKGETNLNPQSAFNSDTLIFQKKASHDLAWNFDNLSYRVLGIGFPFLTIGILSGAVWANEAWGSYWSWDPKETWALLTWLIFAIYLHARITKGWQGKKPAIIASFGFLAIWVCFLGVNLIGEGLHSYGWFSLS